VNRATSGYTHHSANLGAGTLTSTNPLDAGTVTTMDGVALSTGIRRNMLSTVVQVRAKTTVAGTDAVGETFRLRPLENRCEPHCLQIADSPYIY